MTGTRQKENYLSQKKKMVVEQAPLRADKLEIELTQTPTQFNDASEVKGGHTDHMLEVDWDSENGWGTPKIRPYAPISLDPSCSVFHYATECFEGMKAYRSHDGKKVLLFRPELNVDRLNSSTSRLCLPEMESEAALELIAKFVEVDARFIQPGGTLYLRPFVIGTDEGVGIKTPFKAKFMVLAQCTIVSPPKTLSLFCSNPGEHRAWPGGFGSKKLGANYGPTLRANREAQAHGYDIVLWLMGNEGYVTEAGAANFFVVMKNAETGRLEALTCPLELEVILPGVTRRSVLELLSQREELDVVERAFTIDEVAKAADEGRLVEAFACGTAYFVAPAGKIRTSEGKIIDVPFDAATSSGEYASFVKTQLSNIMWGKVSHPWGYVVKDESA